MKPVLYRLLLIVTSFAFAAGGRADTIAVSGVVLNADGQRADGARVALGYAPGAQGATKDESAPAGLFALIRVNADNIDKVYVVIEGDSLHEDTSQAVSLRSMTGNILLGKPGEIKRIKRPPSSNSLRYISPEDAKNRLKNLEEAQTALVIGGHRVEADAKAKYSKGASSILANVSDDEIRPIDLLMGSKELVDKEITAAKIITDDIRVAIPTGKEFRAHRENVLNPSALLRQPNARIPDDVVEVLRDLPARDIPAEWISGGVAETVIKRHTENATGGTVIVVGPASKKPTDNRSNSPLLDSKKAKGSDEAISKWVKGSEQARRAVLIEALREHKGVSKEKRNELDKASDVPRLNVMKVDR